MSRLPLTFECGGKRIAATCDDAAGTTGLLIVTGGNEVRAGAFNGQARLAARIAAAGHPVFRFDRRGIGDSEGENRGWRAAGKDIAAALLAFQAIAPKMSRVVGYGNCDAASALMLAAGAECDALVLANPWTIEADADDTPPAAAVRARYAEKLRNPREIARLVTGGVDLKKLAKGLAKAASRRTQPSTLAEELRLSLSRFPGPVRILLAGDDRTAQVFAENWGADERIRSCPGADHAFSQDPARDWLEARLLEALAAP